MNSKEETQSTDVNTFTITPSLLIYFGVRELRFAQASAQIKIAKELSPLPPERKLFFKFPSL